MSATRPPHVPFRFGRAVRLGMIGMACLAGGEARAELAADNLILDFANPKVTRRDINLSNTGSEPTYVEVQVEEILTGPGETRTTRTGTPDELGLLVTPNRLILAPGQRRPVRAVLLKRPDVERVYQITMKPVVGDVLPDQAPAPGKKSMNIKVLVGYQAIVFVRPAKVEEKLVASRQGRKLRFENAGDVSMLLDSGRQCATPETAAASCAQLPSKRLRPGAAWEVALASDAPVSYTVDAPSGQKQEIF
jgi:P pilus assembly chaperone PapD